MGAVSRDLTKKSRQYDEQYPYESKGITALLRDIYRLKGVTQFGGDIDSTVILTDLDLALNGDCLTKRQRQSIALYYFAGLKLRECSEVMVLDDSVIKYHLKGGLSRLSSHMKTGERFMKGDDITLFDETNAIYRWLNAIANGSPVTEPSVSVTLDLARFFLDDKAKEYVRQHEEGFEYIEDYTDVEEYPCLSEDQMRWSDRRVTYVEEVFPPGDAVGSVKVAVRNEEDRKGVEFSVERRKIFKRRGN